MAKQRRSARPPAAEWVQVATNQLSERTQLTVDKHRTDNNQRSADESSDDSQPRTTTRLPKASTVRVISIIVGVITLATIAVYFVGLNSTDKTERPATAPEPLVVNPTNTPTFVTRIVTATPSPTWTPRPPPTPQPTATMPQPTPTVDLTSYYVELFASCNGRYSGEFKEKRREAAQFTLTQGFRTLSEVIDIIEANCQ